MIDYKHRVLIDDITGKRSLEYIKYDFKAGKELSEPVTWIELGHFMELTTELHEMLWLHYCENNGNCLKESVVMQLLKDFGYASRNDQQG